MPFSSEEVCPFGDVFIPKGNETLAKTLRCDTLHSNGNN